MLNRITQNETKPKTKSQNVSKQANKGASDHDSVKNKDKTKDLDIESGDGIMMNLQGGKRGPTSANQMDEQNQLIDNVEDDASSVDDNIQIPNRAIDNESEPVALKQPYIIPSCSQWFDFESIHEIEYESLPEFF